MRSPWTSDALSSTSPASPSYFHHHHHRRMVMVMTTMTRVHRIVKMRSDWFHHPMASPCSPAGCWGGGGRCEDTSRDLWRSMILAMVIKWCWWLLLTSGDSDDEYGDDDGDDFDYCDNDGRQWWWRLMVIDGDFHVVITSEWEWWWWDNATTMPMKFCVVMMYVDVRVRECEDLLDGDWWRWCRWNDNSGSNVDVDGDDGGDSAMKVMLGDCWPSKMSILPFWAAFTGAWSE